MVELVETPADGLNAAIYKFEGKDFEAKMSVAAMLPGGIAATTVKYAKGLKLGDKLVDGAKILTKNADEVAEGAVKAEKALDGAAETVKAVDVDLKYKDGWTNVQKLEADAKVKALTEAKTVKTAPTRSGTSASSRYKSARGSNSVPNNYDVDHTIELQLGGADDILNMNPLDRSVNRSIGSQIRHQIKEYPYGTELGEFRIK